MRHGSLFSGIGGFDYASEMMGWTNVFQVEIDKFCTKVLEKNFPNVKRYGDIKEFDGKQYSGQLDILTGGFPCQPFSIAGKRKGAQDDRFLWHEMLRAIREIQPAWIVAENVGGLLTQGNGLVFEQVCAEMEKEGYEVQPLIIPACAVNAPHRRDRVWFIANNNSVRFSGGRIEREGIQRKDEARDEIGTGDPASKNSLNIRCIGSERKEESNERGLRKFSARDDERVSNQVTSNTINTTTSRQRRNGGEILRESESNRLNDGDWERNWYEVATRLCGVDARISSRVDRIKSLGNSIVPQVAYEIFKAIKATQ